MVQNKHCAKSFYLPFQVIAWIQYVIIFVSQIYLYNKAFRTIQHIYLFSPVVSLVMVLKGLPSQYIRLSLAFIVHPYTEVVLLHTDVEACIWYMRSS